jgi:hypothetical protein
MMAARPAPVTSHNQRGMFIGYLSPASAQVSSMHLDYPWCIDERSTGPWSVD